MALNFQAPNFLPLQEEPEGPTPSDKIVSALGTYLQYKNQQKAADAKDLETKIALMKARAEYGEDGTGQLGAAGVPAQKRSMFAPWAGWGGQQTPAAADPALVGKNPNEPAAPPAPGNPMSMGVPTAGIGGVTSPTPTQQEGQPPAPSLKKSFTDISVEDLRDLRKRKGSVGVKNALEERKLLTEQDKLEREGKKITFDQENKLADDYSRASKDFNTVANNIAVVRSIANEPPSPAKDISLIFSFMKLNDPASTVREGEYATAANAAGVPDRARAIYNRLLSGEKLAPAQRADFVSTAESLYGGWQQKQSQVDQAFEGRVKNYGLTRENVMTDYGAPGQRARTQGSEPEFATAEAADAAGLPKGTVIRVGGRRAVIE